MTEAKFTPGPWVVSGNATINKKPKGWIASVSNTDRKANAHLIAAAPDLYEVLEEARVFLVHLNATGSLIDQIDEALAKARGED